MSAGRKPLPPLDAVDVQVDDAAIAQAGAAATELVMYEEQAAENTRRLAKRLRYEGPLHPDMLEEIARTEFRRGVDACLRVGIAVALLKEQCPHGEFGQRLERLGIDERIARRFMSAALKMADTSARMREAIGSQSKLFELLVLDDEQIAAIDDGGSVAGIDIDRIARMGVRELRAEVRELQAQVKAKDRVAEEKNAKIDKLSEQLHRRTTAEPAQREQAQLDLLRADTLHAETALLRALATIDEVMSDPATEAAELAARHSVDYLVQKLVDACLSRSITVDLEDRVRPLWAESVDEAVRKGREHIEEKARARAARAFADAKKGQAPDNA